jgi:type 1 glutamine amidotransferase
MCRFCLAVLFAIALPLHAAKKIVLIAGTASHPPGMHEYNAGCLLLKRCLDESRLVETRVFTNGWPKAPDAFDGADAVFLYMDGGRRHSALRPENLAALSGLLNKGVGFGCTHFAVEVPKEYERDWLNFLGGYYEVGYSINPIWTPEIKSLPRHPITRGVKPFSLRDEWYFNIRFNNKGTLTPIVVGKPSLETRKNSYGPYPHIVEAAGRDETLMWAFEREDGGRSFGFTGGHFHENWGNDEFRKLVLNALLWIARVEVPEKSVDSKVTAEQLKENLDPKPKN